MSFKFFMPMLFITLLRAPAVAAESFNCRNIFITTTSVTEANLRRELVSPLRTVKVNNLDQAVETKLPRDWSMTFKRDFLLKKVEYAIRTTSVRGEAYKAYYAKWTPLHAREPMTTIILQHGFSKSSLYFHDMILLLTSLGYQVITPDGADIGKTLKLSGVIKAPSPLDDANVLRDIVLAEDLNNFVLFGHSRGHAVTALVAAMPTVQDRMLLHFASNPYVNWQLDYYLDRALSLTPTQQMDDTNQNMRALMFPFSRHLFPDPIHTTVSDQAAALRKMGNQTSAPFVDNLAAESLSGRKSYELNRGLNSKLELEGAIQIGRGLNGDDISQRGFSTLPLYGVSEPFQRWVADPPILDNGFGTSKPDSGIEKIPKRVLARTHVIYGLQDRLVTPEMVEYILKSGVTGHSIKEGDHYMPSVFPSAIVGIIHKQIQKALPHKPAPTTAQVIP